MDKSITYKNCYDDAITLNFSLYTKCCEGDNCNYEDFDISTCNPSVEYESYVVGWFECYFEEGGAYQEYFCNDNITEVTCDDLYQISIHQAQCECSTSKLIYDNVGNETKAILQIKTDRFLETFSEWNDVLDCDIEIQCDLSSGIVSGSGGPTTAIETTMVDSIATTPNDEESDKVDRPIIIFGWILVWVTAFV